MHPRLPFASAALAALIAVGSLPAAAQNAPDQPLQTTPTNSPASPSSIPPADLSFVLKAAEGGMEEVALGELAAQKATSDQVRQLATTIVQDHQKANQDLMQTLQAKGITVPKSTDPVAQTIGASMSELSGADFDLQYVMQQYGAHVAALAMFQNAAAHAMDPDIKAFAQKYAPAIEAHTAKIEQVGLGMMKPAAGKPQ